MTEYRLLDDETANDAVETVQSLLPDEAELALLSYTGGRAFGWGSDRHDYDFHGYIVNPGWFRKVHTDKGKYDITVRNIDAFEPPERTWPTHRFKQFYDKSNPIHIHEKFDYDEFMGQLEPSTIQNVYPHSIGSQMSRLEHNFSARTALHSYKEILIPLHYLRTGEVESNVVDNIDHDLPGMDACVSRYRDREAVDLPETLIHEELETLFDALGSELE